MSREIVTSEAGRWSPALQAGHDQDHAEALELLRRSNTYALVYVLDDDERGPQGERAAFRVAMQGPAAQALRLLSTMEFAIEGLRDNIETQLLPAVLEEQDEDGA